MLCLCAEVSGIPPTQGPSCLGWSRYSTYAIKKSLVREQGLTQAALKSHVAMVQWRLAITPLNSMGKQIGGASWPALV